MAVYAITKKLFVKKDLRLLGVMMLIYLGYVALRDVLVIGLDTDYLFSDVIFFFKYLVLTFLYCVLLKEKTIDSIIKVTVHLTIISLILYFFQIVGFADTIYNFSNSLNLPKANGIPGYTNFIIFSFTKGRHDIRNSGFVWEPGAFGCFLMIVLLFHFLRNRFTFDKIAILFIVAIITTMSTTNYLALVFLLFLAYRYRVPKMNFAVLLIIPVFIILVIAVPFLGDKIAAVYVDDMKDLNRLKEIAAYNRGDEIPLNRFASMVYLYDNIGINLIWGLSNKYDVYVNAKGYIVNISNGIFDFLAKFGILGMVYLVYGYVKFCKNFLDKNEYLVYCVLTLLILGFGEPIMFLPLVLIFVFLPFMSSVDFSKLQKKPGAEIYRT